MSKLTFVGLGLHDENDISLRGLKEMNRADFVFAELYTSLMGGLGIKKLENLAKRKIVMVSRKMLEDDNGKQILEAAQKGETVLLVPGDPLIATTHVDLRIRAEKAGINTSVIHSASIITAAMGLSGLQNYKFGRNVTIPFTDFGVVAETAYNVIRANLKSELHTLCFLDIRAEEMRYMTIDEALRILLEVENRRQESLITRATLVVGVARAGSKEPVVKADFVDNALTYDFGSPPHLLIFPSKLHFIEADALINLAKAPESIRKLIK